MIFRRCCLGCFLFLVALLGSPCAFAAASVPRSKPSRPTEAAANQEGYKGAITVDAATGNVLFEDNADIVNPPASMTKLMTFAVLHDKLAEGVIRLDTEVTVTAADTRMGGTQVWLKEKEVFPIEELIYAMMVQSANDAAYALARTASGSVAAFVAEMNAKARELGMTHTTFRSPHGLPPSNRKIADGDLTTPRDFSLLCRYLLLKTDVLKYTSVRQRPFGGPQRAQQVAMVNHDNLLGKVNGVDGLKTGYTAGAGFCLSATAQRNSRRVIVVTMGGASSKSRDLRVIELLDRGFTSLPPGGPAFAPETKSIVLPAANGSPLTLAPLSPDEKKAASTAPADPSPVIKFSVPPTKKK
jgi:D-alanyl-D-alanine carboxypeptidase (penicillin-binding protein 5/6)